MNRQQARELGLVKYTGGPTCKRGHNGERYVSTNACLLCSSEYKQTPFAEWTEEYKKRRYEMAADLRHQRARDREAAKKEKAVSLMQSLGLDMPTTRSGAAEAGVLYYFTGKPCIKGHVAKRLTKGGCYQCALEFSSKSKKKKQAEDPEGMREMYRQRYIRKADKVKARRKKYVQANRDRILLEMRKFYERFPEVFRAQSATRRARKRNASPPWLNSEMKAQIKALHAEANALKKEFGIQYDVDHIVPLFGKTVCGLHVPWNMRILTHTENLSRPRHFSDPHLGLAMPLGLGCGATIECYQL